LIWNRFGKTVRTANATKRGVTRGQHYFVNTITADSAIRWTNYV